MSSSFEPAPQPEPALWSVPEEEWTRPPLYRWPIVALLCIAIVALAVGSALFVGSRAPTRYGARADLLYDAPSAVPLDVRQRGIATQRGLILSRAVLEPVARSARLRLADLQGSVSVGLGTQDDLMHITVGAPSRARAVTLTNLVARIYLGMAGQLRPAAARAGDPQAAAEPKPRLLTGAYALDGRLSPQPVRAAAAGLLVGLALATGTAVLLVRRRRYRDW